MGAPVPIGDAQLLFPPRRPALAEWNRPGVEPFSVRAADGTRLRGWILRGRRDAPWLIVDYGNASSMQNMLPLATWFVHRLGYTTVMWDYRGYEFSGGHIDALASRDDALRVYDAVRARSNGVPFVYGLSYGTTLAVHMAASRPVRALVLHAPPSDAMTAAYAVRDRFVPWPVNRLRPVPARSLRIALDEAHEIARVTVPLIVLHGDADALIPISQGQAGSVRPDRATSVSSSCPVRGTTTCCMRTRRPATPLPRSWRRDNAYLTPSSSTSNFSVAFGGITGG